MTYDSLTPIFAALADPTRRSIFDDLTERPLSVSDLAATKPVSRPAVSQHLKVLESAGLVTASPKGSFEFTPFAKTVWMRFAAIWMASGTKVLRHMPRKSANETKQDKETR